jgi:metal-responsive CopG/Arc/MetJ family transcriptional regulator
MSKRKTRILNMHIDETLMEQVEKFRHKRMFPSRAEAIDVLLRAGLKANPERPPAPKIEQET